MRDYFFIYEDTEFEIPDFLLEDFENIGVDEIWHWYVNSGHEGGRTSVDAKGR